MESAQWPRYLRVAHWLHEQRQWKSSQELAEVFAVSVKAIADDIGKLRRRPDVFEFEEKKVGVCTLIHVVHIYPYQLDKRQEPCCLSIKLSAPALIWRTLLTRPWHQMVLTTPPERSPGTSALGSHVE